MSVVTLDRPESAGREERVLFRKLVTRIPSTTYGAFGIYRYPAKFIPQVIAYVLERYGRSGTTIFDPFAGCGTAGLVARAYGLNYEMWDLNPLLEKLHAVAVLRLKAVNNVDEIISQISMCREKFVPQWSNLSYWFPQEVLPYLYKAWGFYHALEDDYMKRLILVPLLKVTRAFSYNDPQRQKLCKSRFSEQRVKTLVNGNWKNNLLTMVADEMRTTIRRLFEYQSLLGESSERTQAIVRGGVDALLESASNKDRVWDFLITSPPYLQAQEYIRCSKMDLFWLGHSEEEIRYLARKELPYREIDETPIFSKTYSYYHKTLKEPKLLKVYERYFRGVLGALTNLSASVRSHLFLFVGPATIRTTPIPIDRIFIEHFTSLGWKHQMTLIDSIVSRVMFRARANPATGLQDKRMATEHLVILSRE